MSLADLCARMDEAGPPNLRWRRSATAKMKRLAHVLLAVAMLASAAQAAEPKRGTLTYSGRGVTCAEMRAAFRKLHSKPRPCRQTGSIHDLDLRGDSVLLFTHTRDGTYRWNGEKVSCRKINIRLRKLALSPDRYHQLAIDCPEKK